MGDYWSATRRKLELGRVTAGEGRYEDAQLILLEARASIAYNDGIESERWGIATLDLATCSLLEKDLVLAQRRGLNALRVLLAAGSPASLLPATDAALLLGKAFREHHDTARAVGYFELASSIPWRIPGDVRTRSQADERLAIALFDAGRFDEASDAALRAWANVEDADSGLFGFEARFVRWTIRCLEQANRLKEASPLWEWLFARGSDPRDCYNLHKFVGKMGEQGLEQEGVEFFLRMEMLDDQRARTRLQRPT